MLFFFLNSLQFNSLDRDVYPGCLLIHRVIAHRAPFSKTKTSKTSREEDLLFPADPVAYLEALVLTNVCLSMSRSKQDSAPSRNSCLCCIPTLLQTVTLPANIYYYCVSTIARWTDLVQGLGLVFCPTPPLRLK